MNFLKRQFPIAICFTVGIVTALQYYVPSNASQKLSSYLSDWYIIITIFASLLGFGSVVMLHGRKIRQKVKGWGYSGLVFLGLIVMLAAGLAASGKQSSERPPEEVADEKKVEEEKDASGAVLKRKEIWLRAVSVKTDGKIEKKKVKSIEIDMTLAPDGKITSATETKYDRQGAVLAVRKREIDANGKLVSVEGILTAFGWLYNYALLPLQGTMFALLGFFVASAAFRSFRAKSADAALLLVTALIVLIGNVPFTNYIWADMLGLRHIHGVGVEMTDIVGWIMGTPNTAARRGVTFGVALGAIATGLKIIFGIERAYLGGGGD